MATMFDPAAFLDLPVEEALVKRPPIPAGDYIATIQDITAEAWQSKTKTDETTGQLKAGIKYVPVLALEIPPDVQAQVGLTKSTLELRDSIMLEMNAQGGIDSSPGKNGSLRRYRDATDTNKPGVPWNARMLVGKMVTVKIAHREYPEGSGDLVEEIKGIAKAG